jgi:hypothetical protein
MSLRRQLCGVLEVVTPSGAYYLSPSIRERLALIWIFRNFRTLPLTVLSRAQRRKIKLIVLRHEHVTLKRYDEILGSVEFDGIAKKPVQSSVVGRTARVASVAGD